MRGLEDDLTNISHGKMGRLVMAATVLSLAWSAQADAQVSAPPPQTSESRIGLRLLPPENDPDFQSAVHAYQSAAKKPELPEGARRFKVQAEDAINDKRLEDAADKYGQALQLAPWWPEGHFNRALVLSETGDYAGAENEMQRYLLLVPDAPNARAAQDKIYIWQGKPQSLPSQPPAPPESESAH
jgi:tetratricopeptide (TPR) repeat protein